MTESNTQATNDPSPTRRAAPTARNRSGRRRSEVSRRAAVLMEGVMAAGAGAAVWSEGGPTRSFELFLRRIVRDAGAFGLIAPTEEQMLQSAIRVARLMERRAVGLRIREAGAPGANVRVLRPR